MLISWSGIIIKEVANMFRYVLSICLSFSLIGCGGSSGDDAIEAVIEEVQAVAEIDPNIADLNRTRSANVQFVNTSLDSMDYFINSSTSTSLLFDPNNRAITNNNNEIISKTFEWTKTDSIRASLGIQDTNSQTQQAELKSITIEDTDKWWAIAWRNGGELQDDLMLTALKRQPSAVNSVYRVRVFSQSDNTQVVNVNPNDIQIISATKGIVTKYLTIQSCKDDLSFNAQSVDLCNLDISKSYLLITDGSNLLLTAEEKQ
ncbi:hypothetical protein [Photobacterium indicum]|uniref:Lipoprotein n=1 Tax=Photobacterium indicum TaxID=81447 RepID=A0A2T3L8V9_9GAMM|nr:hypothetical protein [Photobacterium indicum]PSV47435.1 hypothetical protein C9J47_11185 [Photobacterium indicum]